ncbi:hypothetical protein [Nitratiruptor sp. YY09-18]|uniref:hypothetical protein n=1 Tax=Nitratiruptor sp. YY09-18 TaxID=2724901 RepID=UPI001915B1C4|nr:hypothetical protein [Nitratiruptor sp. YY09-18]BCD68730.1 hypothetical protein NitYY0918_C1647 [Nitratiruptor sp. YY09-18]
MGYIYPIIKEKIKEEVRKFECISKRYELPFCLMLIAFDGSEDISQIIVSNTRCADRFAKIDDHYYSLLFFANRPDSHAKVANKILYALEKLYPNSKISIGVACKHNIDADDIISKAIQNVLEAQNSSLNTIVE